MAKTKSKKKRSRPKSITYKVSSYQIQVKGPKRNEAMKTLFTGLLTALSNGAPLTREDQYGNVIRCIGTTKDLKAGTVILSLVKYNTISTGLKWNSAKEMLQEDKDKDNFNAQKTELIIHIEEHVAFHIHKAHGPTAAQIEEYLGNIFDRERVKQRLDCEVDILPRKIAGEVKKIQQWKTIKKFSIEVIRPNPSGSVRTKQLKTLLEDTSTDKVTLELNAKVATGIKKSGISDLIIEGDELVQQGQGRVWAQGTGSNSQKTFIDSKKLKVQIEEIKTNSEDERTLSRIILDFYENNL